jgi:cobyrinic acid a,c-diamide synthase
LARSAGPLSGPVWNPADEVAGPVRGPRPVVAVAGGAAFTFSYAETAELLTAAGADVVTVDPLHDESLPAAAAGLVIGGGFPEVHADRLAANRPLRSAVAAFAASGAVIAAECAGLLYLGRSLDGKPMCGVLPADAVMTDKLTLGYREATSMTDSILAPAGTVVRGHEFHRTACTPAAGGRGRSDQGDAAAAWRWSAADGGDRVEGFVHGKVHASYLHLHWAGLPGAADGLVSAARTVAAHRSTAKDSSSVGTGA